MSRLQQRRARIRAEYGFDFPDDFYRFWDFLNRLSPLEPLRALEDLGVTPVGPFDVLSGRFDGRVTKHSLLLHWRYHDDPPEFFTVLYGGDGLHWGYWLDDPDAGPEGCVVNCYAEEMILGVDGDDLFDAVRLHLEYLHAENETYRDHDSEGAEEYEREMARLVPLRERLMPYTERTEIGAEYTDAYDDHSARDDRVVANFMNGVGIVVPPHLYRPLSLPDKKLYSRLRKKKDPIDVVTEARQALTEGFPGTALKLGHDLWGMAEPKDGYGIELLDAAYAALGRETLRRVLQTHVANRALPSVDILEQEEA
jgi:hypothetical protein